MERAGTRGPWPVVTLLTDFGTRDPYVAEMKAVILGLTRAVHLVDVTHEIAAHDVREGALVLEAAAAAFPPGSIHVAVVDPGVGTARRGLVIEAHGQRYVGPDNGLFSAMLSGASWRAFALTAPTLRRADVSPTFHGRDVFAPAAAHLARGVPPARFGPPLRDPVTLDLGVAEARADGVHGIVVHVDHFGNLITSIRARDIDARGLGHVVFAGQRLPLVRTYGDLPPARPGALIGSHGRLEIAVREASAARRFRLHRGAPVRVVMRRAGPGRRAWRAP